MVDLNKLHTTIEVLADESEKIEELKKEHLLNLHEFKEEQSAKLNEFSSIMDRSVQLIEQINVIRRELNNITSDFQKNQELIGIIDYKIGAIEIQVQSLNQSVEDLHKKNRIAISELNDSIYQKIKEQKSTLEILFRDESKNAERAIKNMLDIGLNEVAKNQQKNAEVINSKAKFIQIISGFNLFFLLGIIIFILVKYLV